MGKVGSLCHEETRALFLPLKTLNLSQELSGLHPALLLGKDFLKNDFYKYPAFLLPTAQELIPSPSWYRPD